MCNFIILGDFNSAVHMPFETELLELFSPYELIISDYERYGRDSGQFTMSAMRTVVLPGVTISFVVMMLIPRITLLKYWTNCRALTIHR